MEKAALLWSSTEINIGIVCVSIPPLKTIVNKFAPRLLEKAQTSPNEDAQFVSGDSTLVPEPWEDLTFLTSSEEAQTSDKSSLNANPPISVQEVIRQTHDPTP